MLEIRLFGSPAILLDGQPVIINRRKSRALLYYIAASDTPVRRDHLLDVFWPDHIRSTAQQSLRTTIHQLRKEIGDGLVVDDEQIALSPTVRVDARQFEATLSDPNADRNQLSAALDLYRGEFLEGFDGIDDWLVERSEYYRRLALRGLAILATQQEAAGDLHTALATLDRALSLDPLQEDIQRSALRLHYLAGDRAGAIRRYDHLRRLLDDELGVPPMAETRALYDAILKDSLAPAPPATSITRRALQKDTLLPFAGRTAELAQLRALMNRSTAVLALIQGEGGIGKTRLAEEFITHTGALALIGRAHELELRLPYQPIISALRDLLAHPQWKDIYQRIKAVLPPIWLAETARLLPELLPNDPPSAVPPDEARLWEGIRQFLTVLASDHRVILLIDDLQWADAATLALLGYLVRQSSSILYLATIRRDESPTLTTLLQSLMRTGQLVRIPLNRLTARDLETISQAISPAYAYPLAERLGQMSEGNPYVLAEMVRHLRDNDILRPNGQVDITALSTSDLMPTSVYSFIQTRLAHVSDSARRVLDVAVAVGREFEFDVVYRAAGLSEMAALDALDELQAAHLITPLDGGLRFRFDHSLTMEVAHLDMGEVRLRLLHRRVAQALEALRGRDNRAAGLIAWHFAEGGAPEQAAPYAYQAGQQAAQVAAWSEAINLFNQALASDAVPRFDVLMALANAHFRLGHVTQSSDIYQQALNIAGEHQECTARLALSESLLPQARFSEAIALLKDFPEPHTPGEMLFAAQAEQLWGTALSLEGAQLTLAAKHLLRGKKYLEQAGTIDPIHVANLDFELGSIAAQQGNLSRAITLYRSALAQAEQSRDPNAPMRIILSHNNLAYHLHLLSDPAAVYHAERGLELAHEHGALALLPYLYSTRGEIALAASDLDMADHYFEQGLERAEQSQNMERLAGITANRGLIARTRQDTNRAVELLTVALEQAEALGTHHLAAQIQLWLVPLLPTDQARILLAEARSIAEKEGRQRLLAEATALESTL